MTSTTTRTLTLDDARMYLGAALAEKGGDYVYDKENGRCLYVHPEVQSPSCLVGHVFWYMGITAEEIAAVEGYPARRAMRELGIEVTMATQELLGTAQRCQDGGESWGAAVAAAENLLAKLSAL